MHENISYLIKHNTIIQFLYRKIMSFCFNFLGVFIQTDDKLILFSSYGGKQYSDSPKVLFEAMQNDVRFAEYKYVWAFERPQDYSLKNAEKVKIDSLKYFFTALKAKGWVTNVNIERGLHFKKNKTVYLNTWHGTGPKKSGNAVKGRKDYDFSNVDILCCDGEYLKNIFLKYFNAIEKSMVYCGRPREDELVSFHKEDYIRIREDLGIGMNETVVLYMPTWREYGNKPLNYGLWEKELKSNYKVLIRAHHITEADLQPLTSNMWKDVTDYPSVNKLYCVADILVSDYSSAFWDYSLLSKPMFCYAYDYEKYCNSTGLLIDLAKEFPNGIIKSEEELIRKIKSIDYLDECKKTEKFCKKYLKHSESATQYCLNRLDELIKKK